MLSDLADHLKASLADRYAIERELGRGGMATVFLARDLRHDRPVALKVLHPELAATLGPERFQREIRLAARLQHPHILTVHDSGESAGQLWFTMPFVEGESLRDRLSREQQLPVDDALRIAIDAARALEYAHQHGVIHRDIKPENLLLTKDGSTLVADFGIARALGGGDDQLTQTGMSVGTPAYMSPEQAAGDRHLDGRTDVYALGAVLYEMLAGEPPFTGPTPQAIIAKRYADSVRPVRRVRPAVPAAVDSALMKALAQVPADRFATIAEFAVALQSTDRATEVGARKVRGLPPLLVAVALYVLAALAVLGVSRLLTTALGLPDWVLPAALVLLVVGLPIIVTTAVVQRQAASAVSQVRPRQSRSGHWLTWRRALSGGGLAFAVLGVATAGYMALRALGIGPVGTLLAAGVLEERDRIVIADFQNTTPDSLLGSVVTEAFRIDLAQSPVVTVVPPTQVAEVLTRMKRTAAGPLDPTLAREVAVREGVKAVLVGEIARAGTQYVLSAQLVSAGTGEVLAARRETARDSTELIGAIDRLSKRLRERVGESLKTIRRDPPLERVTTGSLEALRKYAQAIHAGDHEGDNDKAIALLEQAVALDSGFAMAHRTLGIYLANSGAEWDRVAPALRRAMAYRHRLTEREQYLTQADYYWQVTYEPDKAIAAYRALLESHPNDREALNNLGVMYRNAGDFVRAEPLFRRALALDSLYWQPQWNLVWSQVGLGKRREAEAAFERLTNRVPDNPVVGWLATLLASSGGNYPSAEAEARAFLERQATNPVWRATGSTELANVALVRGKLAEGKRHLREALDADVEAGSSAGYLNGAISQAFLDIWFRGEPARALAEVASALARYPLDSLKPLDRPYIALAEIYAKLGKPGKARALLTEYERVLKPEERRMEEPDRHGAWGEIAMAEGRLQDAADEFRKQVKGNGGECPTCGLAQLGRGYDRLGASDSAIVIYERYVATPSLFRIRSDATELAGIYKRLGELYEERREREKSQQYYSRFVDLWKDCDPELRPQLTEVRRRMAELAEEPGG